jgi:hypothetical protein
VRRFVAAHQLSITAIELDTERDEVTHSLRPFGAQHLDGDRVAQPGTGAQVSAT